MPGHVLALEFRGLRETADFGFVAELAAPGRVRRIDPIVAHQGPPLSLTEQAQRLVDGQEHPATLILAYCTCAALALHVAARARAHTVLVDPDPVRETYLREEFSALFRTLGENPAGVLAAGDTLSGEPLAAHLESALCHARDRLVQEHGADRDAEELVTDLLARYRGWLRFLCASAAAPPAVPGGPVTVLTSKPIPPLTQLLTEPAGVVIRRVAAGPSSTLDLPEARALITATALGQTHQITS